MAVAFPDNVQERCSTTGQGDLILAGAVSGCFTFASALSDGDKVYYRIREGARAEGGQGTYVAATNRITRDRVIFSTAGAGVKAALAGHAVVWADVFGEWYEDQDATGNAQIVAALTSIVWGSPGVESANIIEIQAITQDFAGNPLSSDHVDVEIRVTDGATDNEPSATATLTAAGSPIGNVLRGSGTATLGIRTDGNGHLAIAVHETAAAHRYLWIHSGGNSRLWVRSATGVQELVFT